MLRLCLCLVFCLVLPIGCGQRTTSEKEQKEPVIAKDEPGRAKVADEEQNVNGFVITKKAKDTLELVPIKAHQLLTSTLDGGTLVLAEFGGQNPIGFSGGGFKPTTSNDWSGFYIGKAVRGLQADDQIKLRSFTIRAVVSYSGIYECKTNEATAGETQLLKQRGYLK